MNFRPFYCVLFLAAYLPVEEFILKWLPVPEIAFLLLRQLPDLLILGIILLAISDRVSSYRPFQRFATRFDWFIALFVVSAVISVVLSKGDIVVSFVSLKGVFRYLALAYIVRTYPPSEGSRCRFFQILVGGVILQIALGFLQLAGGTPARNFLAARNTTEIVASFQADFTGTRSADANNLMGTMGNTINYGTFMLVGLALLLSMMNERWHRYLRLSGIILIILCIWLTGSRSSLIASGVMILIYVLLVRGFRKALICTAAIGVSSLLIVLFLPLLHDTDSTGEDAESRTRILDIFTSDYIEVAMQQRLGLVVYVAPDFLRSGSLVAFGLGSDPAVFVPTIQRSFPTVPAKIVAVLTGILDDVFWLALMIHFGVVGVCLFAGAVVSAILQLKLLYRLAPSSDGRSLALFALLLMVAAIPLNFFNQVFVIRQFSFYLWITFALALPAQKKEFYAYSLGA